MGVSTCATCDGFFFRDQDIAVVGGGDSAMEEATFLTRFARSVTLIHRRDEFRASKIMLERARANEKITFLTNTAGDRGRGRPEGHRYAVAQHGHRRGVQARRHGCVRRDRPRSRARSWCATRSTSIREGYVLVKGRTTSTSVEGVFAAGDLVDHTYRQAITAAGTGCSASIDAERWLAETASATTDDSTDLIGAPL